MTRKTYGRMIEARCTVNWHAVMGSDVRAYSSIDRQQSDERLFDLGSTARAPVSVVRQTVASGADAHKTNRDRPRVSSVIQFECFSR